MEILLLLALFLLPVLTRLLCGGSFGAVWVEAGGVRRLLSIDATSRYFYIFLHIYRTLSVAGGEASAWICGVEGAADVKSFAGCPTNQTSYYVYTKIYTSIPPSHVPCPAFGVISICFRVGRKAMANLGLGILPSIKQAMRLIVAYRCRVVLVARYRLLLGTRQMATHTYDVSSRRAGDSLASKINIGPRRQSTSSTAYSPTLLL
jgi:hypothetical protein